MLYWVRSVFFFIGVGLCLEALIPGLGLGGVGRLVPVWAQSSVFESTAASVFDDC